jgi:ADP-ribose pyrophosphatase YjhB (NUDIX family)
VQRQRVAAYGVAVVSGRVLLTRLTALTSRAGWWTLPGGGIDHGEDPRDAVVREVAEETGLVATVLELLDVYSSHFVGTSPVGVDEDFHAIRIVYRVDVPADVAPVVVDVGGTTDAAAWFPLEQLDQLPVVGLVHQALERVRPGR